MVMMRSPAMATPSATVKFRSTVMTRPLIMIRSGAGGRGSIWPTTVTVPIKAKRMRRIGEQDTSDLRLALRSPRAKSRGARDRSAEDRRIGEVNEEASDYRVGGHFHRHRRIGRCGAHADGSRARARDHRGTGVRGDWHAGHPPGSRRIDLAACASHLERLEG